MEAKYTYQLGFNAGYLMAKYKKTLLIRIKSSLTNSHPYIDGMNNGIHEFEIEYSKVHLQELDKLREGFDDKENSYTRD